MTLAESAFRPHRDQSGLADRPDAGETGPEPGVDRSMAATSVTVLFATETGASEEVAKALGKALGQAGLIARVVDMADADCSELAETQIALFVASTTGDGDAPYAAEGFFAALESDPLSLSHLRYAVLALGDSTYADFCAAGRRLDESLAARGATRLLERVDCDIDYEEPAAKWRHAILETIARKPFVADTVPEPLGPAAARHSKYRLTEAIVVESRVLTGEGSTKTTRHVALTLPDPARAAYEPGDALGIIVRNDPSVVAAVLEAGGLHGEASVKLRGEALSLSNALELYLDISALTPRFLDAWAAASQNPEVAELAGKEAGVRASAMRDFHLVDIMRKYPARNLGAQAFVDMLRSLQPRLYSIASSLRSTPGQVHLTMAPVSYRLCGEWRKGVATSQICDRTEIGSRFEVYVHANAHFRLPKDDAPIIMIGAGTGIAPYRGFLQERAAQGSTGPAWLFFGERNRSTDFLYEEEWDRFLQSGALTRIDTAFSRDGGDKVYVQHRLVERAGELCEWIAKGAHIYVCGDATNMAPDVHRALIAVLETGMGLGGEAAEAFLAAMQNEHRYQRDVY